MGNIYHEWNGTTLIITSDSGTSSCDLKGQPGDIGIRGPQGPAYPVFIDNTLAIEGAAADAKAVGEALANISNSLKVYKHSWYGSGGEWGDVPEHIFSYLSFNGTPEEGLTPSNCEGRGLTIINERKGFLAKNTLLHDIIGTSHTQNGNCFAVLQYGNLNFESGFGSMPMSLFDTIIDEVIEL